MNSNTTLPNQAAREPVELSSINAVLVDVFLALNITAGLGIILVLLTMLLSARVQRQATWINFYVSWVISCTSYSVLFFAGRQRGAAPSFSLCLTQASLIYGAPVLTAFTGLALVLQLLSNVCDLLFDCDRYRNYLHKRTFWLIFCPYVTYFMVIMAAIEVGIKNPSSVSRDVFYCHIGAPNYSLPGRISSAIVIIAANAALFCEVSIAAVLRHRWLTYKHMCPDMKPSLAMYLRVGLMTTLAVTAICIAMFMIGFSQTDNSQDLRTSAFSTLLALIPFGMFVTAVSRADVLSVWMFWKKPNIRYSAPEIREVEYV